MRSYFKQLAKEHHHVAANVNLEFERKQVHVLQLINAYRFRGHQQADINPLTKNRGAEISELSLRYHELSEADYETFFETGSLAGPEALTLNEIYTTLRTAYCGSIGTEYMHIMETAEKRWIQQRLELAKGVVELDVEEKNNILRFQQL